MRSIKVGCGQGFYGDSLRPAIRALEIGGLDYMCFDALAELTLAILSKDRAGDSTLGYTKDLPAMMVRLAPLAKEKGTVLISNGGGLNPSGAAAAIASEAAKRGIANLRIAYVEGDDVLDQLASWQAQGVDLSDYDSGEKFKADVVKPVFANVYLGAESIRDALALKPDIVVTGRTTDTAAYLGPVLSGLSVATDDWDKVATAIVVGHLLECAGQASGGNFSGDWWNVENLHDIGYPTAEVFEDGRVIISKPQGTGGRVSRDTLKEQILYEIHDPTTYITPDVIVDLSNVNLVDVGPDMVELTGIRGKPAPATLKLIMGVADGYMASAQLAYSWPYALEKARLAGDVVKKRIETEGLKVDDVLIEYLGVNSIGGPTAPMPASDTVNEVALRAAIRCPDKRTAVEFRKLFPPLALNTGPFVGGLRGTSHVGELLRQWSCLVPRTLLDGRVNIDMISS